MKSFVILADATCDLSEEFQKEYDIGVIPGHIELPDGTEIPAFLKWEKNSREDFYAALKKNPNGYSTSPANVAEFSAAMEPYAAENVGVLLLTISSGISGAFNFASQAREELLRKYPSAEIRIVDSMRFGPGFGLMAVYASMLRSQGKTLAETAQWLEDNKNRFHQAGWLDDLSFVAKKGRITQPKAFFGTLAGVKPIGEFDYNGLTTVLGKVKGAKTAYSVLLGYMEATIENPEEQIIFIAQTNRLPQAVEYKKMIEEKFHPKAVFVNDVFPSCGINIGPGLMAAYYMGKPISRDLSEERALFDKLTSEG